MTTNFLMTLTPKDYLKVNTLHILNSKRNQKLFNILLIVGGLIFFYGLVLAFVVNLQSAILHIILGLVLILFFPVITFLQIRGLSKNQDIVYSFEDQYYTFTIEHIQTQSQTSSHQISWIRIKYFMDTKDYLVIYYTNNQAFFLVKDQLTQENFDTIKQILAKKQVQKMTTRFR